MILTEAHKTFLQLNLSQGDGYISVSATRTKQFYFLISVFEAKGQLNSEYDLLF